MEHENFGGQINALLAGALSEEESVETLLRLKTAQDNRLDQEKFKLAADAVRATLPADACGLFDTSGDLIDCCGTGGSGLSHYNTSTTVAFVLAAAGLKVTKFGNRAASSLSGSFDLLDRLGVGATLPLPDMVDTLDKTGLVFLFAPQFYPALKALAPLRRKLGQPTVFNLIGPVLNPANPVFRLIGVPNQAAQTLLATYLRDHGGISRALVVHAASGLDELDVHCQNSIARVGAGSKKTGVDHRPDLFDSFQAPDIVPISQLQGKRDGALSVEDNLAIFNDLISAQLDNQNYYHALVCLNAAGAMHAAGLIEHWEEGIALAADLIKSGAVKEKVIQYQAHFKSKGNLEQ